MMMLCLSAGVSRAGFFSPSADKLKPCEYASVKGDEFVFEPQLSTGGDKYDYLSWYYQLGDTNKNHLSYDDYVGKHGKMTGEIIGGPGSIMTYEKAIVENCDIVYVEMNEAKPDTMGIYFSKDAEKARSMVGKSVWIKNPNPDAIKYLVTADEKVSYPVKYKERVLVTDISLGEYGNTYGSEEGIFLKVKTDAGKEGYLKWNSDAYYSEDPAPVLVASEPAMDIGDAVKKASALVGKYIWLNDLIASKPLKLITKDEGISYPLHQAEKLQVTGISQDKYDYAYGDGPFFLKVKKETGEEGLIKYNSDYLYTSDPIPKGTPKKIRALIEQGSIAIGMTEAQTRLSVGAPDTVNKTVGQWGVHEQWVYAGGNYIYFENGKLVSFQVH
jgi:hypothetical protein